MAEEITQVQAKLGVPADHPGRTAAVLRRTFFAAVSRMRPRDIPRREWPVFLAAFGRRHRSWLSSIEGPQGTRVVDEPLDSLAAEEGAVLIRLRHRQPAAHRCAAGAA